MAQLPKEDIKKDIRESDYISKNIEKNELKNYKFPTRFNKKVDLKKVFIIRLN